MLALPLSVALVAPATAEPRAATAPVTSTGEGIESDVAELAVDETSTALSGSRVARSARAARVASSPPGASISHSSGPRQRALRSPVTARKPIRAGSSRPRAAAAASRSARRSEIRVDGGSSVIVARVNWAVMVFMILVR